MLTHILKKMIFIHTLYGELVLTTMLALMFFGVHSMTIVFVRVIANIQYQICARTTVF